MLGHRRTIRLIVAALTFACATVSLRAHADALPPMQKMKCPAGTQLVHDHGGTRCVRSAPSDCPPGWSGQLGGTCVLAVCQDDSACGKGAACKPAPLCSSVEERAIFGGDGPVRGAELAAPPRPARVRVFRDVCRRGKGCGGRDSCRMARVCLAQNVDAPADRPRNGAERVGWEGLEDGEPFDTGPDLEVRPDASLPSAVADGIAIEPTAEPATPGKSGGCAGCAVTSLEGSATRAWSLAALAIALGASAARRRR